jgi:uncharacterized protein
MSTRPEFRIRTDEPPSGTLLAGFSELGLAGLTAVDYLATQLDLEEVGHISAEQLPAITPFEAGIPRHHTRLFSRDDLDVTVLVGELFAPRGAAEPLATAIMDWVEAHGVDEVTVVSGVPIPHGPEDHRAFYVATEDYQAERLAGTDVPPMGGGFLEGVNATLMARGIDSPLRVGVLTTPAHPQSPDVEAALRLLSAVEQAYDFGIDTGPLESFAEEVTNYYTELADRMAQVEEASLPEDRMYM